MTGIAESLSVFMGHNFLFHGLAFLVGHFWLCHYGKPGPNSCFGALATGCADNEADDVAL